MLLVEEDGQRMGPQPLRGAPVGHLGKATKGMSEDTSCDTLPISEAGTGMLEFEPRAARFPPRFPPRFRDPLVYLPFPP